MLAVSNTVLFTTDINRSAMTTTHSCDGSEQADSIPMIVHSLMCYRQSGESKEFARRAIESLVKKLKDKKDDLDSLITAITTNGTHPSKCVTIQRTLDGRMQIAGRKCLPHIIYARIWRWPDLHRNELKHCKFCSFGFGLKQDSVCINPYHYERAVSPVDFGSLSLSPENENYEVDDASDSESDLPDTTVPTMPDHAFRIDSHSSNPSSVVTEFADHVTSSSSLSSCHTAPNHLKVDELLDEREAEKTLPNSVSSTVSRQTDHSSQSSFVRPCLDRVNPAPHLDRGQSTMAWSGIAIPSVSYPSRFITCSSVKTNDNQQSTASVGSFGGAPAEPLSGQASIVAINSQQSCGAFPPTNTKPQPNGRPIVMPAESSTLIEEGSLECRDCMNTHGGGTGNPSGGNSGGAVGGAGSGISGSCGNSGRGGSGSNFASGSSGSGPGAGSGGWNQRSGPPFNPSGSLLQPVPMLTTQRPPEFWCNIAYFELDQQVGELFKVPSQYSRVTVDGYTAVSSPNRFCLGQLSNVHRSEQSEKSRLYIGKGVELDNVGEGDVWIRCLSEFSVFVQSYYLDREAGRRPGDAVHKIYPGAYIKVFDIRQCHEQMKLLAHSAQLAAEHQAAVVVGSLPSPTVCGGPPLAPHLLPTPGPSPSNTVPPSSNTLGMSPLVTADVGVDDLRRLCMLRLSFVKGWGPDYPRRSIKETPCWIEIQLHRPLQLLDEVLQGMPLNDRKPTRHFFPYFSQPTGCTAPRPSQAATRRV
ncbi:hypothetical protein AHF37_02149 [Paragonimus kellicotti]|nr:hypothetical protein AHF37_02149 [Paragonimus kellicotti]